MNKAQAFTLSIDCGGLSVKASVLDEHGTMLGELKKPTPYPLSPSRFLELVDEIVENSAEFHRITVGFPGMIRHGVVIHTPHYINAYGPHTELRPQLKEAWTHFDLQSAISHRFNKPTLVLNDADVHGAGVVSGTGFELMLTFGTGLGYALFDGGELAPHIELSHSTVRRGTTIDHWIGEHERRRLGDTFWSRRVRDLIIELRPVFLWDRLYVGGGNAKRIKASALAALGDDIVIVPNSAGITGGVRAWDLQR
jgi:polyphosphate glucokinase